MSIFASVLIFAAFVASSAYAQPRLQAVPPVQPTRSEDCDEHQRRWTDLFRQAEAERFACERRDGGTVRSSGVWLPNCGYRIQAYVTCAAQSDQVCAVSKQGAASMQSCRAALQAHREAELARANEVRRRESQMQAVRAAAMAEIDRIRALQSTANDLREKGIAGTIIDNYTTTPEKAAGQVNDYMREAARTANTRNPDGSPTLNRAGEITDGIHQRAPFNPVVKEVGRQSNAASRARMGDAVSSFEGQMKDAEDSFALPTLPGNAPVSTSNPPAFHSNSPVPTGHSQAVGTGRIAMPVAGEGDEAADEELDRRTRAANIEAMRQVIEQSQQLQRQLHDQRMQQLQRMRSDSMNRGGNTPAARRTCRGHEVVGFPGDEGLPYCQPGQR